MFKTLAITAILFTCGFAVNAQDTKNTDPNAPEIVFEKDVHDFGNIEFGGDGTYAFRFTNTGKDPLVISDAKGSCGCTVPKYPKEPILKGQSNVINVSYDTKRVGPFTKTVTVNSNAKSSVKVITIKGNVLAKEQLEEMTPFKSTNEMAPVEKTN